MKNGKKLYNERGITFFHETESYVNNLNIYNRWKNGTNLWDDLIHHLYAIHRYYFSSVLPDGRYGAVFVMYFNLLRLPRCENI